MTRLLVFLLILVGATVQAAPPPISQPANWRVVDADGQFVAYTTPFAPTLGTRMVDGRWLVFSLEPAGIFQFLPGLFYESADCTGPALLHAYPVESFTLQQAGAVGSVLYFNPPVMSGALKTIHSASSGAECFPGYNFTKPMAAPVVFDTAPLGLVPPFSLVR